MIVFFLFVYVLTCLLGLKAEIMLNRSAKTMVMFVDAQIKTFLVRSRKQHSIGIT